MKNKRIVIVVCLAILGLLVGFVGFGVMRFRDMITHKVFQGDAAISFIRSHPGLSRQWDECGFDDIDGDIIKVGAASGVMQSGARFYVVFDFREDAASHLAEYEGKPDSVLEDKVLDLYEEGSLYQVASRAGYDGPEIVAIRPRDSASRVIYYAYAGDGS